MLTCLATWCVGGEPAVGQLERAIACGFKAVSPRVVREILPLVRNRNWFFESEMLYIAERKGFRIKEVPVDWKESEFSGIRLYKAILEFIKCSISLRLRKLK